jgi:putative DNA primase/helicase
MTDEYLSIEEAALEFGVDEPGAAGAKQSDQGRAFVSWGGFSMTGKGLVIEKDDKPSVLVSGPFEVLGRARDPEGNGWGRFLRWFDQDGRQHTRHVPDSALYGEPAALCGSLADAGLRIARQQQSTLMDYLAGCDTPGRVTIVARTGWHEIGGRPVFVLPKESIGGETSETVALHGVGNTPYETRGTLADWQAGVATLALGHVMPVLAISAAFAGPLLYLAGQEGGGIHFVGQSSKGKTTLLQAAASVWGVGGTPGYVRAWRATANGLEGAAASASDTCLVLDELGQVDARDAAAALYSLSNGSGKQRAGRGGELREGKSWRVLVLSSGEIPTESKLSEDRTKKPRAGQLVRLLDVEVDRGFGFGAFDNGGPDNDAGQLAQRFKREATAACGMAGPKFVRMLIDDDTTGSDIRAFVDEFVSGCLRSRADGQVERAARRFGLIAAAGEFAIAFGIVPWPGGSATDAAAWALRQWIERRGGTAPAEDRQAIEQVRRLFEEGAESRFDDLGEPDARPILIRLGWREGSGADRLWFIPPEVWKTVVCNGLSPAFVAQTLAQAGILERGNSGLQRPKRIRGAAPIKVYVINATIFEGAGDGV